MSVSGAQADFRFSEGKTGTFGFSAFGFALLNSIFMLSALFLTVYIHSMYGSAL